MAAAVGGGALYVRRTYEVKLQLKLSFGHRPGGFIAAFFFTGSAYLCVGV